MISLESFIIVVSITLVVTTILHAIGTYLIYDITVKFGAELEDSLKYLRNYRIRELEDRIEILERKVKSLEDLYIQLEKIEYEIKGLKQKLRKLEQKKQ